MKILLVDDDESTALLFRLVAASVGANIRLEVASDGQKAIDHLAGKGAYADRTAHPVPDLVILDLFMPGMSGFDVLDWCHTHPELWSLPKVVFSGSSRDQDKEKALAKGAVRFIPKPNDLSSLKLAILEMLDCAATRAS